MIFPDIMVDLETTGTSPDETAIIQIAAVRFNLQTGEVDPNVFDMCLSIPPRRYWDESTRAWWAKMPDVLMDIWKRQRPPELVMRAFADWVRATDTGGEDLHFWSKPISFDWAFLQSYFRQFEVGNPFHYRHAQDMNTFIRSRYYPLEAPPLEKTLEFDGDQHNALDDAKDQATHAIDILTAMGAA